MMFKPFKQTNPVTSLNLIYYFATLFLTKKLAVIPNSCWPTGAAEKHWNTEPESRISFVSFTVTVEQAEQLEHF